MDLQSIETYIAAVENGSIKAAATALGLSRSTVRRHLEVLEERIGTPLLVRSRDGLVPTPPGALLLEHGRALLAQVQVVIDAARAVEQAPQGELRVALPNGLPTAVVAHFHAAILARWPAVDLELLISEAPLSHLPRRAHFAVIFDAPSPETGFDVIPLRAVPTCLLASPAYLARRGPIRSVADLADHAILRWTSGHEPPNLLRRRDGSFVEIAPRLVSNDVQVVRDMAGLGAGLAYAPDGDVPTPLQRDQELVRVLEDEICSSRTLELHVPAATRTVPKVRHAVEMLTRLLGAGA